MSIKAVELYTVECDSCGESFQDIDTGFCAWYDGDEARYQAEKSGWYHEKVRDIRPDRHYCPDCWDLDDDDNLILNLKHK